MTSLFNGLRGYIRDVLAARNFPYPSTTRYTALG
ncbi:Uncharacterised protein [Mycobacteroides abscessus subsp. abscessus]|nr:Uncharacterised protein [Mycobacteroides abscessus subsp. abscessus]